MKTFKKILAALLCVCLVWGAGLSVAVFAAEESPYYEVEKISLDKNVLSLNYGATYTFKATVSPSEATNYKLVWKSDNDKLATVDGNGKVTIAAASDSTSDLPQTVTVTVSVSGKSSVKDSCVITVSKNIGFGELIGRIFNSLATLFTTLFTKWKDPSLEIGKVLWDALQKLIAELIPKAA